ncbi:unnamed protein product [Schistocephalus solidus]|uniref:Uncharacterized protein n=1 Tax=Schistocephalus solidus TaxID=70667 RepID=A0A183SNF1_SCHSO|nr:unnamed protein product [Schistocephalus solidus]
MTEQSDREGLGFGGVGPGCWRLSRHSFGLGGGDPFGLINCCTSLHGSSPCRSILGEVLPGHRVDFQLLQRFLQSVLVASFLTSLSASPRSDISVEKSFGKSLVVHSYQVAGSSQLHLPQHGVDAEDSGPLQEFRVRDPVLPSQPQYSVEAPEMEIIKLSGLARVDGPGLRSVKECRQDDCLVHLQFDVQVNTVAIPHGGLQSAEGLTGFGDPFGNLNRLCQLRDTIQSTALDVLGLASRQHQDWLDDNGAAINALLVEKNQLKQLQLRWSGHLVRTEDKRQPNRVFYGDVAMGSSRRGGQERRYKDTLKTSLKQLHINPVTWEYLAQDRTAWRRSVKTGSAIYEAKRIATAKAKRAAGKSFAPAPTLPMPKSFKNARAVNAPSVRE